MQMQGEENREIREKMIMQTEYELGTSSQPPPWKGMLLIMRVIYVK